MFDVVFEGLVQTLLWPAPLYLLIGIAIGLIFGAVPGLGGLTALALLLPFTFSIDPVSAFSLLIGMYAVVTTSDTISSVLLGVPGTAASQATILDGYPMALRGEAARALGAAFTVSAIGGVLGAVVLALSIPIVRPLVLTFASPEFFMLAILGLTMVGSLSGTSLTKGLAAAAFGVLLSTVGYAPNGTAPRYAFDDPYLFNGLPLVPFVLGLFALPELMALAVRGGSIAQVQKGEIGGGTLDGMKDAVRHWWLVLRSTLVGVYIGTLPGVGGSVVDWIAYGHAVQSARDKSGFGKGDIRGVIAPEAANNAMKGGSLIPTIAFAIPGNASMAILLGAFTIHGLEPGMGLLSTRLDFTFSLVWMLAIANVVGAAFLLVWAKPVAKAAFIDGNLLIPAIVPIVFMGAWLSSNQMGDWIVLLAFGALGLVMRQAGWPRPPLVLGFLLGSIMEDELHLSVASHGLAWLGRPIVIVLGAIALAVVLFSLRRSFKSARGPSLPRAARERFNPIVSLGVTALVTACFIAAIPPALGWRELVGKFPLTVAIPGLALALIALGHDLRGLRRRPDTTGAEPPDAMEKATEDVLTSRSGMGRSFHFLAWLLAVPLITVLAGQLAAMVAFAAGYLVVWGRYGWKVVLPYAVGVWAFMYGLFEWLVPVVWYRSLLLG